jgi:hypothetical protein
MRGEVGPTGCARIWWRGNGRLRPASASAETKLILVKFNWDKNKRTGIAGPYFHNSYICITIMLITSLKRTPLIKSSNMSTWKIRLHRMVSYYKLQKRTNVFSLVVMDGCICMLGINLDLMIVISSKRDMSSFRGKLMRTLCRCEWRKASLLGYFGRPRCMHLVNALHGVCDRYECNLPRI